jgi:hypothetical protein
VTEPLANSLIITFVGSCLAAVFTLWLNVNKQRKVELEAIRHTAKEQSELIAALTTKLEIVNTQMSPLWARVQAQIVADLHHPNPRFKEMDDLLEGLGRDELSVVEYERLEVMLGERAVDMHPDITKEQRAAAAYMVTSVMPNVIKEKAEAKAAETAVGSVAMIEGATKPAP